MSTYLCFFRKFRLLQKIVQILLDIITVPTFNKNDAASLNNNIISSLRKYRSQNIYAMYSLVWDFYLFVYFSKNKRKSLSLILSRAILADLHHNAWQSSLGNLDFFFFFSTFSLVAVPAFEVVTFWVQLCSSVSRRYVSMYLQKRTEPSHENTYSRIRYLICLLYVCMAFGIWKWRESQQRTSITKDWPPTTDETIRIFWFLDYNINV